MSNQQKPDSTVFAITECLAGPQVKNVIVNIKKNLLNDRLKIFTLDFSSCNFIDSSGIGALVSLSKEFQSRNVQMILKNLNSELSELFIDTRLDRFFSIQKNDGIKKATIDLFKESIDIRLILKKEIIADVCIILMSGVMNYPLGSQYFKQQLLLSLSDCKFILLDMEKLTFFDSLSINAVLCMNNLLKNTGGFLQICGANYIIQDLLKTLCIDAIIPIFDTRKEALDAWGSSNV